MKEIKLPSGAVLKISHTPFAISKALYQAVLEEAKQLKFETGRDLGDILKDVFCLGFSSKRIEAALYECFKRCTYNDGKGDFKIDETTFESMEARQDYTLVCIEVAHENVSPFMNGLSAGSKRILATMQNTPS